MAVSTTPAPRPIEGTSPGTRRARLYDDEYTARAIENERRVTRFALLLTAVAAAVIVAIAWRLRLPRLLIYDGILLAFALYYWRVVPRLLFHTRWLHALRTFNITLEITIPSLIGLLDIFLVSPAYALTSLTQVLVLTATIGSGIRLDRKLSLYAGVLAAAESLAVYGVAAGRLEPSLVSALPSLGIDFALYRATYLLLAGVLAALFARFGQYTAHRAASQQIEKERVADLLSEYVSPEAVGSVLAGRGDVRSESRRATVLFADIVNFTGASFAHPPEKVVAWLNSYFSAACVAVGRHRGMVNKFIGDGLLAVFGAPDDDPQHALHAAAAALALCEAASRVPRPDGKPTRIGVGLHTGTVLIGSIGAAGRRDYTVVGDTVNVASRLESLTRRLDADVLITDAVAQAASGLLGLQSLGRQRLRGREEPVQVYRLISASERPLAVEAPAGGELAG
ncbi:MAG: adenylate/guanylate cyclase domain-containing protein [Deltaproteobacteria bacterium]|nr:adenylate/guanylate cyclase domain-containing protein [Deltaproteobacteria bacterium]